MEPFLSMGHQMVMAMPWTSDFDANSMKTRRAPVWVNLPLLNPAFEYYTNLMLAKIGIVL